MVNSKLLTSFYKQVVKSTKMLNLCKENVVEKDKTFVNVELTSMSFAAFHPVVHKLVICFS